MADDQIPAIVLSCDEYHPFVEHMIRRYGTMWPDHPFRFHVPFQDSPSRLQDKFGSLVRMVKTPKHFRPTVLGLLEGFNDNDLIYWCLDDKYLVDWNRPAVTRCLDFMSSSASEQIGGLLFCRPPTLYLKQHVRPYEAKNLIANDFEVAKRFDYSMIWIHQFIRVAFIRHLFQSFPATEFRAKEMDHLKTKVALPDLGDLLVTKKSQAFFGESTTRGKLTQNCFESFGKCGQPVPKSFAVSRQRILVGHESFLGLWLRLYTRVCSQAIKKKIQSSFRRRQKIGL